MKINTPKLVTATTLIAVFMIIPQSSHALSCMDPGEMIKGYINQPGYKIVTAIPTDSREYVREKADKEDPNKMYDSGYTSQLLKVQKVHQGVSEEEMWVYYGRDATWNYSCVGELAKLETENIYILSQPNSWYDIEVVVGVYPIDSSIAKEIILRLEESGLEEGHLNRGIIWDSTLYQQIKEITFLLKIKITEWAYWKSAK